MLKPEKAKNVVKIMGNLWFEIKRQTWSHIIMRKDSNIVVIPFHGSKDIPIPTLKSIIKQAWITEKIFLES